MNKKSVILILLFSGLWGFSEAVFGQWLYTNDIAYASVYLTTIALLILTLAKNYLPQVYSATLIAALALLYKFFNTPLFLCHSLAILCIGISFDSVFSVLKIKNRPLALILSTYAAYASFALLITYGFRYEHWVSAGIPKVLRHIFVSGTITAAIAGSIAAIWVFLCNHIESKKWPDMARLAPFGIPAALAIWLFALVMYFVGPH